VGVVLFYCPLVDLQIIYEALYLLRGVAFGEQGFVFWYRRVLAQEIGEARIFLVF